METAPHPLSQRHHLSPLQLPIPVHIQFIPLRLRPIAQPIQLRPLRRIYVSSVGRSYCIRTALDGMHVIVGKVDGDLEGATPISFPDRSKPRDNKNNREEEEAGADVPKPTVTARRHQTPCAGPS